MIDRYRRPELTELWTDRRRFLAWLEVERAVCAELTRAGRIPRRDGARLDRALAGLERDGGVDPARVLKLEARTRHDVIAFTTAVAEKIGPLSRYVHFGLTSSDVVDTALSCQVQRAGKVLLRELDATLVALRKRAREFKSLPTIGRTHGIFAEPTVFGLKFLGWATELGRGRRRLAAALEGMRFGKLSGAVGASPHWEPAFEERALRRLGLEREPVSTQVLPRDRHAELFLAMALVGASLERACVELRHLQRSEVDEAREGFAAGQKGSSAMPHKRNPISAENLTGCARLLRGYALAALENVALWHERDISHSSVERVAFPDATQLLDYMLARFRVVVEGLEVRAERVRANLELAGARTFSGHVLLALVEAGMTREEAYLHVQRAALRSQDEGKDFGDLLAAIPEVSARLGAARARRLGSLRHALRHVPEIYRRADAAGAGRRRK